MKTTIKLIRNILEKFNLIANLTAKNLALHQQLIVLNRSIKRPQLKTKDRLFWIILYLFWNNWQESLIVLKPETVVGWHKRDSSYFTGVLCAFAVSLFLFFFSFDISICL